MDWHMGHVSAEHREITMVAMNKEEGEEGDGASVTFPGILGSAGSVPGCGDNQFGSGSGKATNEPVDRTKSRVKLLSSNRGSMRLSKSTSTKSSIM
jgi:hypothetical protein